MNESKNDNIISSEIVYIELHFMHSLIHSFICSFVVLALARKLTDMIANQVVCYFFENDAHLTLKRINYGYDV